MAWRALLEGDRARRARALIRGAAEAISSWDGPLPFHLYGGHAGLALMHAELARAGEEGEPGTQVVRRLELALGGLEAGGPPPAGLFGGLAGVALALRHGGLGEEALLAQLELALAASLEAERWSGGFDLFDGLVGIGVYFAAAPDSPRAERALERVIALLEGMALPVDGGAAWPLPAEHSEGEPFRRGAAHGQAGALSLLARVDSPRAQALYARAAPWLEAHRDERCERAGWCSGELGVAGALLCARDAERALGLALGKEAALRPFGKLGLTDLALCHGLSGVAHLANRLWQATAEPAFEALARQGFDTLLGSLDPGTPASRWRVWQTQAGWSAGPGLLEGLAGVALALHSASSALEPRWDFPFLLGARVG